MDGRSCFLHGVPSRSRARGGGQLRLGGTLRLCPPRLLGPFGALCLVTLLEASPSSQRLFSYAGVARLCARGLVSFFLASLVLTFHSTVPHTPFHAPVQTNSLARPCGPGTYQPLLTTGQPMGGYLPCWAVLSIAQLVRCTGPSRSSCPLSASALGSPHTFVSRAAGVPCPGTHRPTQ